MIFEMSFFLQISLVLFNTYIFSKHQNLIDQCFFYNPTEGNGNQPKPQPVAPVVEPNPNIQLN